MEEDNGERQGQKLRKGGWDAEMEIDAEERGRWGMKEEQERKTRVAAEKNRCRKERQRTAEAGSKI